MTVPILRTTVMLILANAFVPLTLRDKSVNSVKKITGDFLLNLAARYGRLGEKPWLFKKLLKIICLIQMSEMDSFFENHDLYSVSVLMQHAHIKTKNSKTTKNTMFIEEPSKRAVFENTIRVLILDRCMVHTEIVRCVF